MAQEYEIIHFDTGKEPFIDRNGNQWCNVLFKGEASTPIKWVMRPDSVSKYSVGSSVYGRVEDVEGKNYKRFYKEQVPDGYGSAPQSQPNQPATKHDTDESIARAVALKAAVEMKAGKDVTPVDVLREAGIYLAWLKQESPLGTTQTIEPTTHVDPPVPTEPNPKRPWENRAASPSEDPGLISLAQTYDPMNDPNFDPNQVPY